MLIVNASASLADDRFLFFSLVCLLKLFSKLFLFLLLRSVKGEKISPLLFGCLISAHARLLKLCYIFRIHVQMLYSKLQNPIETSVDVSFVTIGVKKVFQEMLVRDLFVA